MVTSEAITNTPVPTIVSTSVLLIDSAERNEGPLVTFTRSQAEKLVTRFQPDGVVVDWAMRYGKP